MRLANTRPVLRGEALDALDRLRGRRDPLVPPRRMIFVGAGDYRATGEEFFGYFRRAGLEPSHDVLDVGCGIGRMALPMAGWLTGEYRGFDIVRSGIDWCNANITPRHPNFRFEHADIYNGKYNPGGRERAETYRFPCDDSSIDFAFLTSVFTHMTPPGVLHYLAELRRVVRPGGTIVATYFLLDTDARAGIAEGRSQFAFQHAHDDPAMGEFLTINTETIESAIAFERARVEAAHVEHGVPAREVWAGQWSGRADGLSLQDIVVADRR